MRKKKTFIERVEGSELLEVGPEDKKVKAFGFQSILDRAFIKKK